MTLELGIIHNTYNNIIEIVNQDQNGNFRLHLLKSTDTKRLPIALY